MSAVSHRIIADLLFARTGQQLQESRRWRIDNALAGLFRERRIANVDQLVCLLAEPVGDSLADEVVEALLNNETYFFRDRQMFDLLACQVLPALAEARRATRRLRIWSAGCSTGQEPLSLAMLFSGRPDLWDGWRIDILGTDISGRAVAAARGGLYSQFEIQRGLGVNEMLSWFEESGDGWRSRRDIAARCRFEKRNVLAPPPSGAPFDLVLCRNVLLYFDRTNRRRALDRIAEACAEDGWLLIGSGENAAGLTGSFAATGPVSGLYRRVASPAIAAGPGGETTRATR